MDSLIQFAYVASAALFIYGLKQLGSPATARRGNMISAVGLLLAIVAALLDQGIDVATRRRVLAAVRSAVGASSEDRVTGMLFPANTSAEASAFLRR